jgi:indolepyruvate ferredoxin oxidoreductase
MHEIVESTAWSTGSRAAQHRHPGPDEFQMPEGGLKVRLQDTFLGMEARLHDTSADAIARLHSRQQR